MAGTDFNHLTDDEILNGIKALNIPNYIRSKSYGIDVRETLAQMTEMLMQLAYNQGMDPQQAKDWVSQLNNKIDKGNLSVTDINKNLGKLDQTYMTDEFIQQMAGNAPVNAVPSDDSITSKKLTRDSVTLGKVEFLDKLPIINKQKVGVNVLGTELVNSGGYTVFAEVEPNTVYKISVENRKNINRFRVFGFENININEVLLETGDRLQIDRVIYSDDTVTSATVTIPTDINQIAIYLANNNAGSAEVFISKWYEKEVPLGYKHLVKKNAWGSINNSYIEVPTASQIAELQPKVMFAYVEAGFSYDIKVETRSEYINRFRVYGFKSDYDKALYTHGDRLNVDVVLFNDDNARNCTVFIPEGIKNIGVYIDNGQGIQEVPTLSIQTNLQSTLIEYSKNIGSVDISGNRKKYFAFGEPKIYSTENYIDPTGFNVASIMNIYADIESSDFVTKNILGQDPKGNNIYEYVIDKPLPQIVDHVKYTPYQDTYLQNYSSRPKMKMLLVSGTHGDEVGSVTGMAVFIKELLTNTTDETLRYIRNNLTIKLIPILNPSGLNANTRSNSNGVDINRDYVAKSQPEIKIATQWIDDNDDAIAFIDYHNSSRYPSFWPHPDNQIYHELFFAVAGTLKDKWMSEDETIVEPAIELITNTTLTNSQTYAHDKGMLGMIVEGARGSKTMHGTTGAEFDAEAIKHGNELLVNTITTVMKYYS